MCFYIYAPESDITLHYVAETIELKRKKYNIVVDIVLENNSEKSINELLIIFPHNLMALKKTDRGLIPFLNAKFSDISHTFHEDKSPYNRIYRQGPVKYSFVEKENGTTVINMKWLSPQRDNGNTNFETHIKGKNELKLLNNISNKSWEILIENEITLLKCCFSCPLQNGEIRLLRWLFSPPKTYRGNYGKILRGFNWFRDNVIYHFELISPHNVCRKLREDLIYFKKICHENKKKSHLLPIIDELIEKICKEGINKSTTKILDWRLNLFRGRLMHINIISETGDIRPTGDQPNFIKYINEYAFQWISGPTNNLGDEKKIDFTIAFETKYVNIFYSFLPWFALILAIIAVIMSLVK